MDTIMGVLCTMFVVLWIFKDHIFTSKYSLNIRQNICVQKLVTLGLLEKIGPYMFYISVKYTNTYIYLNKEKCKQTNPYHLRKIY